MLGPKINLPGLGEAMFGVRAFLDNPEGMFKTNKDGCPGNNEESYIKGRLRFIRPMKQHIEGD